MSIESMWNNFKGERQMDSHQKKLSKEREEEYKNLDANLVKKSNIRIDHPLDRATGSGEIIRGTIAGHTIEITGFSDFDAQGKNIKAGTVGIIDGHPISQATAKKIFGKYFMVASFQADIGGFSYHNGKNYETPEDTDDRILEAKQATSPAEDPAEVKQALVEIL